MIAPIWLLLELAKFIENPDCRSPLTVPHKSRHGDFGWHHHQKVHVIRLNVHFDDLAAELVGKHLHTAFHLLGYWPFQYSESVLWHPHNVILAVLLAAA